MTGFFLNGKTDKPSPGGRLGREVLATPKPERWPPIPNPPTSHLLQPTSQISANNPLPVASQPPPPRGSQKSAHSECRIMFGHRGPRPEVRGLRFSLRVYFAITQSVFFLLSEHSKPSPGGGLGGGFGRRKARKPGFPFVENLLPAPEEQPPSGLRLPPPRGRLVFCPFCPPGEGFGRGSLVERALGSELCNPRLVGYLKVSK